MGLVSRRSTDPRHEAVGGVGVIDTIIMKPSLGIAGAPGVVAILDGFRPADPGAFVGQVVRLRTPSGATCSAPVEAVRDHGTTISFFFRGLNGADVPVGSRVEFDV